MAGHQANLALMRANPINRAKVPGVLAEARAILITTARPKPPAILEVFAPVVDAQILALLTACSFSSAGAAMRIGGCRYVRDNRAVGFVPLMLGAATVAWAGGALYKSIVAYELALLRRARHHEESWFLYGLIPVILFFYDQSPPHRIPRALWIEGGRAIINHIFGVAFLKALPDVRCVLKPCAHLGLID